LGIELVVLIQIGVGECFGRFAQFIEDSGIDVFGLVVWCVGFHQIAGERQRTGFGKRHVAKYVNAG